MITSERARRQALRHWLHRIWIIFGIGVTVIVGGWSLLGRASQAARAALVRTHSVSVEQTGGVWRFEPTAKDARGQPGRLISPGGLVEGGANTPLARAAAIAGFPAVIVELQRRGAFGGADSRERITAVHGLLADPAVPESWMVAGHSRGGVVASDVAVLSPDNVSSLVLMGTAHPRDVSLTHISIPALMLDAAHNGLARPAAVRANAHVPPARTQWVWFEGANHSQFAWYGIQPMDRPLTMGRTEPQRATIAAVPGLLRVVEAGTA